jgi:uncharacterized membrane protein YidH (DUF202 family)
MASNNNAPSYFYTTSRSQIENNDMSIGLRLIWLNNCLAFMFGVYAVVTLFPSATPYWHTKAQMLSVAIPYIGVLISLFTLVDILAAINRMNNIRNNFRRNKNAEMKGIPMLDGTALDRFFQRFSPVGQALLFLVVWLYLLLYDKQIF